MLLAADAAHHRPGHRRVDGRFWTLTDDDKADDDEVNQPAVTSPTPLDLSCESIQVGYSEEHVANCIDEVVPPTDSAWDGLGEDGDRVEVLRRIVRRRMSASAVQPWKGPLPKVIFKATSWIRTWSLLIHVDSRELMDIGCNRWEMVARAIFSRFWMTC
ncbi:uncharacterized protein LOC123443091 [Hordeum vulgare subsp. vulgare]|uniref:Uncharacterized protein n=1 Tax=Hordeum vulgare subsp. vulgare TaxID=112509 RepID=A0A8I6WQ80_HORVV|nr:uncharacterized protein LOC123443091 [Hordeum vulgare subsp. vulgare]